MELETNETAMNTINHTREEMMKNNCACAARANDGWGAIWDVALVATAVLLGAQPHCFGQVDTGATFTRVTTGAIVTDAAYSFSCAWGDYDGDGYLDLVVGNGFGDPKDLYHNEGDGTFAAITNGPIVTSTDHSGGCTWGDYDNDGDLDLFVAIWEAPSQLFRNNGDGTFTRIIDGDMGGNVANSNGASWGDYDDDGFLDLIVANSEAQNEFLYHNNQDGTFTSVTNGPVPTSGMWSGGPSWDDYDEDGNLDLYVSPVGSFTNSLGLVFRNEGGGTFTRVTNAVLTSVGEERGDWIDYDNDGDLDLSGSRRGGGLASLVIYRNDGGGVLHEVVLDDYDRAVVSPGTQLWGDYDNDGWLDLFLVSARPTIAQNDLLYHNNGDGTFTRTLEGEPVNTATWSTGGNAWVDYDNDGFLDLFLANGFTQARQANSLYHNDGNSNHWLQVTCEGTTGNRSGIGATVRVQAVIDGVPHTLRRQVTAGSGYHDSVHRVHFGLGDATNAGLVRIEWPSGTVQELTNVDSDQILNVIEPPRIEWELSDTISWPASAGAFQLETTDQPGGIWTNATDTLLTNGHRITATLQTSNTASVYRLRLP